MPRATAPTSSATSPSLTNGYQAAFIGAAGVAVAAALAALTLLRTSSGAAAEPQDTLVEKDDTTEAIAA